MKRVLFVPDSGLSVEILLSAFETILKEVRDGDYPHMRAALKAWIRQAYAHERDLDYRDVMGRAVCQFIRQRFNGVILEVRHLNTQPQDRERFELLVCEIRTRLQSPLM